MKYRIFQDNNGYHVQIDFGKYYFFEGIRYSEWRENWKSISTCKTLKEAKKARQLLEISQGRVIE